MQLGAISTDWTAASLPPPHTAPARAMAGHDSKPRQKNQKAKRTKQPKATDRAAIDLLQQQVDHFEVRSLSRSRACAVSHGTTDSSEH